MQNQQPLTVPVIHDGNPGVPLPSYANPGDAGLDLRATGRHVIQPGQRELVPTGIKAAIPVGHVGLIHPRSGLALKHGVTVLNAPGTIDSGYRGEIGVVLINHDPVNNFTIEPGDRIAQLVIQKYEHVELVVVEELPDESVRGAGGFGSTGVSS